MSEEKSEKILHGPDKTRTLTHSPSKDLRTAALSAFQKVQDPWGKTKKPAEHLLQLSKTEAEYYALDYGLRRIWELQQKGDDTVQCNINPELAEKLRKVILETLQQSLDSLTHEHSFEIPDPEIFAQREEEKRKLAIEAAQLKKERQKQVEEERRSRQARLQESQKHRSMESIPEVTLEALALTTVAEPIVKSSKKSKDSSSKSKKKEKDSKSTDDKEKKKRSSRKRLASSEVAGKLLATKSPKSSRKTITNLDSKKTKRSRSKSPVDKQRSSKSKSESTTKEEKISKESTESTEKSKSLPKNPDVILEQKQTKFAVQENTQASPTTETSNEHQKPSELKRHPSRYRKREILNGTRSLGRPKAGRPLLAHGGGIVSEEEPIPTISFTLQLVDIIKLNDILDNAISTAFSNESSYLPSKSSNSRLDFYHMSIKGPRPANEDELTIVQHANEYLGLSSDCERYSFIGVYDGHCGKQSSLYTRSQLHCKMAKHQSFPSDIDKVIFDGFLETDRAVNDIQVREKFSCGTTALAVWIRNEEELIIGNVGDCRGYVSRAGIAVEIASQHSPNRDDERERIKEAGGTVVWFGTWRVNGILAVSRSIGDNNLKNLVIADPDITRISLSKSDEFLVMASDGLWDGVPPEEAIEVIKKTEADQGRRFVCQALCNLALERVTKDNVTVVVVFFD